MIKIGDKTYPTSKPKDLDEALAHRGVSAAEMRRALSGAPIAGQVAAALHPFLKDAPSVPELAGEIQATGVVEVLADVVKLYGEPGEDQVTDGE